MLNIERKIDESVTLVMKDGTEAVVMITSVRGGPRVTLGVQADRDAVKVHRTEVLDARRGRGRFASAGTAGPRVVKHGVTLENGR